MASQAKAGECPACAVPVVTYGGMPACWQCPRCHVVSASRMPPLPRGATVCPVCLNTFTSVRRHWAQQWALGGLRQDGCRRFYEAGMIWSKDRPAWASHSEQSNG